MNLFEDDKLWRTTISFSGEGNSQLAIYGEGKHAIAGLVLDFLPQFFRNARNGKLVTKIEIERVPKAEAA